MKLHNLIIINMYDHGIWIMMIRNKIMMILAIKHYVQYTVHWELFTKEDFILLTLPIWFSEENIHEYSYSFLFILLFIFIIHFVIFIFLLIFLFCFLIHKKMFAIFLIVKLQKNGHTPTTGCFSQTGHWLL